MTEIISETLNGVGFHIITFAALCVTAYIVVFLVLRLLKVQGKVANFFGGLAFLGTMYYAFVYQFVPGIQNL